MQFFSSFKQSILILFLLVGIVPVLSGCEIPVRHADASFPDMLRVYEWVVLAELGDSASQAALGMVYRTGKLVQQDFAKAAYWFEKAGNGGNEHAQVLLGVQYKNGQGVPKDYTKAVYWFQKAANQGNCSGKLFMGIMYMEGKGVPVDLPKAYSFFSAASKEGNEEAINLRDLIAKQLTPKQLENAKNSLFSIMSSV